MSNKLKKLIKLLIKEAREDLLALQALQTLRDTIDNPATAGKTLPDLLNDEQARAILRKIISNEIAVFSQNIETIKKKREAEKGSTSPLGPTIKRYPENDEVFNQLSNTPFANLSLLHTRFPEVTGNIVGRLLNKSEEAQNEFVMIAKNVIKKAALKKVTLRLLYNGIETLERNELLERDLAETLKNMITQKGLFESSKLKRR